jgi:hypothetical protein
LLFRDAGDARVPGIHQHDSGFSLSLGPGMTQHAHGMMLAIALAGGAISYKWYGFQT